jgi:intracellular sulfur oxidation DsrE/DsrF family protein
LVRRTRIIHDARVVWVEKEERKMKSWNRGHVAGSALIALAILAGSGGTAGNARGERAESFKNGKSVRKPNGKLVFMLTTGFEDLWEVRLCLEDIKAAKASGYLEEVIWLVRGRGVDALGSAAGVLTRPPVIIQLAREVKASGVRVIVSTEALQQQQIPVASLDPTATDLVDNTAMLMVELESQGYQVIRY